MGRGAALRRSARALVCAALLCLALAGCGNPYGGIGNMPAPPRSDFPSASGQTLESLLADSGESGLVVLPTGLVFDKGRDRYGFGVFTAGKEQVTEAQIALYFSRGATGKALGPYPARIESLATKSAFVSQTTGEDSQALQVVYVVDDAPLRAAGEWRILALVKSGNGVVGAYVPSAMVGRSPSPSLGFPPSPSNPPAVGQRAPRIHTPTKAEVGGDLRKIDTRIPPDDMHEDDFADVLGRKPVVLLFATPQFCQSQSRVCGPVVDEAEQVKQEFAGRVSFIHMEIYNEDKPNKGVRPQVKAFHLPSEPWLFVINRHGIIRTRIEGAWGISELARAVRGVLAE